MAEMNETFRGRRTEIATRTGALHVMAPEYMGSLNLPSGGRTVRPA